MTEKQLVTIRTYCLTVEDMLPACDYDIKQAEARAISAASEINHNFAQTGPNWLKKKFLPRLVQKLKTMDTRDLAETMIHCEYGVVKIGRTKYGADGLPESVTVSWEKMITQISIKDLVRYNPALAAGQELFIGDKIGGIDG